MKSRILLYISVISLSLINPYYSQYKNIKIWGSINSHEPEECSIVISPLNTNHMLASSNQDNYFYSTDGGNTWKQGVVSSPYGVLGDPNIAVSNDGKYFYFYLTNNLARIGCNRLPYLGGSWSQGTSVGLNGTKQNDKQWSVLDRKNNYLYSCWAQFDKHSSSNPSDSSVILLSRSTDEGNTWSVPVQISNKKGDARAGNTSCHAPMPAIGPGNDIYVTWMSRVGLMFDKSSDGGVTWLNKDIQITPGRIDWLSFNITGVQRTPGFPVMNCDLSGGKYNGNIYICWTDQSSGTDNSDVWIVKSSDKGANWTKPKKVNGDNSGRHQFFGTMATDQVTGKIYIVYYDRRNYPAGDTRTDVYMSVSEDGGDSFSDIKISESSFSPVNTNFIGDYIGISAHNDVVRPIWTRVDNNQLSLWTAIINPVSVGENNDKPALPENFFIVSVYPNPFNASIKIKYDLKKQGYISLKIYDILGKEVDNLLEKYLTAGEYTTEWNAKHFASGTYYLKAGFNDSFNVQKIVLAK